MCRRLSKSSVQSRISPCFPQLPEDIQHVLTLTLDIVDQVILNAVQDLAGALWLAPQSNFGNVTWDAPPAGSEGNGLCQGRLLLRRQIGGGQAAQVRRQLVDVGLRRSRQSG